MRVRGFEIKRCLAAFAVGVLLLAGGAAPASAKAKPKAGTYAGAGSMIGDAPSGMQVGFDFDGTTVTVSILGFTAPGCNGFASLTPAQINGRRFKATGETPSRSVTLKGRWTGSKDVSGRMVMTVPPTTNCGTPGTYVYAYSAKRYGKR